MTNGLQSTNKITEKQFSYIRDLAAKRDWREAIDTSSSITIKMVLRHPEWSSTTHTLDVSIKDASHAIGALLRCKPIVATASVPSAQVTTSPYVQLKELLADTPSARYALQNDDGAWIFYRVVRKKSGAVFVNRLVGAPGDWMNVFISIEHQLGASKRIAANPKAAAIAFSQQAKRCSVCASPLSDEKSLADSMGPVCAKKFN
jgi:hypothetical protein